MNSNDSGGVVKQVCGVLQVVPQAYDDILSPGAKEIGKGVHTIAKALNVALSPLDGLVWGFERLKEFLENDVCRKLKEREATEITTPLPSVAVPTLAALAYLGKEPQLREFFANLLVSAIDIKTAERVHPAFVEIIKQLSSNEAKILSSVRMRPHFPLICEGVYNDGDWHDAHSMTAELLADFHSFCNTLGAMERADTGQYFDNLLRLRIFEIREVSDVEFDEVHRLKHSEANPGIRVKRSRYEALYVTQLGTRFLELCVS